MLKSRSEELIEALTDAQLKITYEPAAGSENYEDPELVERFSLTYHQKDYWRWWSMREINRLCKLFEQIDDPISEAAESLRAGGVWEMEIIRTISDAALETRWARLEASQPNR